MVFFIRKGIDREFEKDGKLIRKDIFIYQNHGHVHFFHHLRYNKYKFKIIFKENRRNDTEEQK